VSAGKILSEERVALVKKDRDEGTTTFKKKGRKLASNEKELAKNCGTRERQTGPK